MIEAGIKIITDLGSSAYSYQGWFWLWLVFFISGLGMFGGLLGRLPQRSYTLGAGLSFLFFGLITWQLAYLKLVPLSLGWLVLIVWVGAGLWVGWRSDRFRAHHLKILLKEFGVFVGLILVWFWVRGFQPDIIGLEKYMDFGFLNSVLRSSYLPARDMWWAGGSINYYYFGHFLWAVFSRLSAVPSQVGYNLSLASIFGLSFVLTFFLMFNLLSYTFKLKPKLKLALSLWAAVFLNFASNWQTVYGVVMVKLGLSERSFYWYPDATRFIDYRPGSLDKTIHEFPAYSHVVADLHGHLLALPLELILLFLLSLYVFGKSLDYKLRQLLALMGGAVLGAEFMTSSWDVMGFGVLWALTLSFYWLISDGLSLRSIKEIVKAGLLTGLAFIGASLLFKLNFDPFFKGIDWVRTRSVLWMWLLLWEPFLLPISLGLWFIKGSRVKKGLIIFGGAGLVTALYLLIFPEVFYMKDIYADDFHRANTVFKLTYQAYIMLTFLAGLALVLIRRFKFWLAVGLLAVMLPLMYPFYSIPGYYGRLKASRWRGGDGWYYLRNQKNGDYQIINYLNQNVTGQPVIVEAVGEGYTQFARVSANTGLPAVLGWPVHEWLWRNQGYGIVGARRAEVADFYQNPNLAAKRAFIDKYKVKYIVVGWAERQAYDFDEALIKRLGRVIFQEPASGAFLVEVYD